MGLFNAVYNRTVRPLLPTTVGVFNGVAVRGRTKLWISMTYTLS